MSDATTTTTPDLSTVEEHLQTDAKLSSWVPEVPSLAEVLRLDVWDGSSQSGELTRQFS